MADQIDLQKVHDGCLVGIAAHGRNALTGGPVGLLPPRLWDALRLELQRRYRNATGEEFAVLVADHTPSPQPRAMGSDNIEARCGEIADIIEPGYRKAGISRSCTGILAKRWNASFNAAHLAITGKPYSIEGESDAS